MINFIIEEFRQHWIKKDLGEQITKKSVNLLYYIMYLKISQSNHKDKDTLPKFGTFENPALVNIPEMIHLYTTLQKTNTKPKLNIEEINQRFYTIISLSDLTSIVILQLCKILKKMFETMIISDSEGEIATKYSKVQGVFNYCIQTYEEHTLVTESTIKAYNNYRAYINPKSKPNNVNSSGDNNGNRNTGGGRGRGRGRGRGLPLPPAKTPDQQPNIQPIITDSSRIIKIAKLTTVAYIYLQTLNFEKKRMHYDLKISDKFKTIRYDQQMLSTPIIVGGSLGFLKKVLSTIFGEILEMRTNYIIRPLIIDNGLRNTDNDLKNAKFSEYSNKVIEWMSSNPYDNIFLDILTKNISEYKQSEKDKYHKITNNNSQYISGNRFFSLDSKKLYLYSLDLCVEGVPRPQKKSTKYRKNIYDIVPRLTNPYESTEDIDHIINITTLPINPRDNTSILNITNTDFEIPRKYGKCIDLLKKCFTRSKYLFNTALELDNPKDGKARFHDVIFYVILVNITKDLEQFEVSDNKILFWFSEMMNLQSYVKSACYTPSAKGYKDTVSWIFHNDRSLNLLNKQLTQSLNQYDTTLKSTVGLSPNFKSLYTTLSEIISKYNSKNIDELINNSPEYGEKIITNKLYHSCATYRLITTFLVMGSNLYKYLKESENNTSSTHNVPNIIIAKYLSHVDDILENITKRKDFGDESTLFVYNMAGGIVNIKDKHDMNEIEFEISTVSKTFDNLYSNPTNIQNLCVEAYKSDILDNMTILITYQTIKLCKRYIKSSKSLTFDINIYEKIKKYYNRILEILDDRIKIIKKLDSIISKKCSESQQLDYKSNIFSMGTYSTIGVENIGILFENYQFDSRSFYSETQSKLDFLKSLEPLVKNMRPDAIDNLDILSELLRSLKNIFRFSTI